jgi:hypothetical protein
MSSLLMPTGLNLYQDRQPQVAPPVVFILMVFVLSRKLHPLVTATSTTLTISSIARLILLEHWLRIFPGLLMRD